MAHTTKFEASAPDGYHITARRINKVQRHVVNTLLATLDIEVLDTIVLPGKATGRALTAREAMARF